MQFVVLPLFMRLLPAYREARDSVRVPFFDKLVELMAEGLALPYLDIPLQHASPKILKAMRRPGDVEGMLQRIEKWREQIPEIALRSTFIVGFPGETEEDFEMLLDAARELPEAWFLINGDGAARSGLESAAAGLPNVIFRGYIEPEQLESGTAIGPYVIAGQLGAFTLDALADDIGVDA